MMNDTYETTTRSRIATADYPQRHSHDDKKKRTPSAKLANKSLVTKVNDKPTNPTPDVIASHEAYVSYDASSARSGMNMVDGGIKNTKDVKQEKYKIRSTAASHATASTSKVNLTSSRINDSATVEDLKVQIHRLPDAVPTMESNLEITGDERKRKSSITHSEKEALGTLDDVVRTFEDFDENFNEIDSPEEKLNELKPDFPYNNPSYETVEDLRKSLMDTQGIRGENTYNSKQIPRKYAENELIPVTHEEAVYAKPIKPAKNTSFTRNYESLNPPKAPSTRPAVQEKPATVLTKKFEIEEDNHEIKFSALRQTSPSASLSQSLNKTNWANSNESQSPKRKAMEDNNSNFFLRRGQLSGPVPNNADETYVEPPRDYDMNGTLSSIGRSTTISDESFTRDTWGSLTSSSTSGSRKVKELRPEALKMIEKRKVQQEDEKDTKGRHHDGLVNRSFKIIKEASVKESTSKTSLTSETASQSDIENIKNEADKWLANYERVRANSKGKKGSIKSSSGTSKNAVTPHMNERKFTLNVKNGLAIDAALPLSETTQAILIDAGVSKDVKVVNGSSASTETARKVDRATNANKESIRVKSQKDLEKAEENSSSDDDNLVRLMETGFTEGYSTDPSPSTPERLEYVPRALRMSFGQSWEGIRKDRREWKSREMKHATSSASRKGGKRLSNRLDDQEPELEMLF